MSKEKKIVSSIIIIITMIATFAVLTVHEINDVRELLQCERVQLLEMKNERWVKSLEQLGIFVNHLKDQIYHRNDQMVQMKNSVDELLNIVTEMKFPSDGNIYVSEKQQFFWDKYLSEEIPFEGTLFFVSPYCGELKNEDGSVVYVLRAQQGLVYTKTIPKIAIVEQK